MALSDPFRLEGRHALVCGASQGIGHAIALRLAAQGARVSVLARSKTKLEELFAEIANSGGSTGEIIEADLDQLENARDKVRILISKSPVNILINNSGGPAPGPLAKATDADFQLGMNRHLFACQSLVQMCLPGMTAAGYGRIINIVSTSVREPLANLGVSNVVRGAIASWSKTWAMELPPGVTINNILPGYTETPRLESLKKNTADKRQVSVDQVVKDWIQTIPEARLGKPDEIATAAAFLASPAASYIRGISLAVDGGRTKSL